MKKIVFILVILISASSCKKKSSNTKTVLPEVKIDSVKVGKISIKESSFFVDDWAEITSLESEIKLLLTKSLKSEKDVELLKAKVEEVKKSIPENFKTPAIQARIKVIETETMMLEQYLKDVEIKKATKQLERIFTSYNTFVGQIEAFIIKQKDYETYK